MTDTSGPVVTDQSVTRFHVKGYTCDALTGDDADAMLSLRARVDLTHILFLWGLGRTIDISGL